MCILVYDARKRERGDTAQQEGAVCVASDPSRTHGTLRDPPLARTRLDRSLAEQHLAASIMNRPVRYEAMTLVLGGTHHCSWASPFPPTGTLPPPQCWDSRNGLARTPGPDTRPGPAHPLQAHPRDLKVRENISLDPEPSKEAQ